VFTWYNRALCKGEIFPSFNLLGDDRLSFEFMLHSIFKKTLKKCGHKGFSIICDVGVASSIISKCSLYSKAGFWHVIRAWILFCSSCNVAYLFVFGGGQDMTLHHLVCSSRCFRGSNFISKGLELQEESFLGSCGYGIMVVVLVLKQF
jgi:hypothetical protein